MIDQIRLDSSVDEMERALSSLVTEIVRLSETLDEDSVQALNRSLYTRSGPALTPFKIAVDLIASSPVDGALRFSVMQIGERLFRVLESPDKMMRVARRVCSEDEINWSRRMTIIDAAWQGIGSDRTGYWG